MRKPVSLGGDGDTLACVAGVIAGAIDGGVPPEIAEKALECLTDDLLDVVSAFYDTYVSLRSW